MKVGIPKEIKNNENRVGMTPVTDHPVLQFLAIRPTVLGMNGGAL